MFKLVKFLRFFNASPILIIPSQETSDSTSHLYQKKNYKTDEVQIVFSLKTDHSQILHKSIVSTVKFLSSFSASPNRETPASATLVEL